jgi:hypothetical protein
MGALVKGDKFFCFIPFYFQYFKKVKTMLSTVFG